MRELLGALLAANIIGFAVITFMLYDHNDEYHNKRESVNSPHRNIDINVRIPYDRSPHYRTPRYPQQPSQCPPCFRYAGADIYVEIDSGCHYQYIGSNTYINLSTGRRVCP